MNDLMAMGIAIFAPMAVGLVMLAPAMWKVRKDGKTTGRHAARS